MDDPSYGQGVPMARNYAKPENLMVVMLYSAFNQASKDLINQLQKNNLLGELKLISVDSKEIRGNLPLTTVIPYIAIVNPAGIVKETFTGSEAIVWLQTRINTITNQNISKKRHMKNSAGLDDQDAAKLQEEHERMYRSRRNAKAKNKPIPQSLSDISDSDESEDDGYDRVGTNPSDSQNQRSGGRDDNSIMARASRMEQERNSMKMNFED